MEQESVIYWNVRSGGAVSIIIGERRSADFFLDPFSSANKESKNSVEKLVLKYSCRPDVLDKRLGLEASFESEQIGVLIMKFGDLNSIAENLFLGKKASNY